MKTYLILLCLVSMMVACVSGCASWNKIRQTAETMESPEERLGVVAVQHWLEPSTTFDLARNKNNTLAAVLSETRNLANASAKRKLSHLALEQEIRQDRTIFQENCVMLVRRNQRFYFPTSLLALPEVAGLCLRPNDVVLTLPMKQSVFAKQHLDSEGQQGEDAGESESQTINVINQAGEIVQTVLLQDDLTISSFLDPFASPVDHDKFEQNVSLSLVSRQDGSIIHHLILPTVNKKASNQGAIYEEDFIRYVSLQLLNSHMEFQDQDTIQLSNLEFFVGLF